jgi:hypothetical protein
MAAINQSAGLYVNDIRAVLDDAKTRLDTEMNIAPNTVTIKVTYATSVAQITKEVSGGLMPLILLYAGKATFPQGLKRPRRQMRIHVLVFDREGSRDENQKNVADLADDVVKFLDAYMSNHCKYQVEGANPVQYSDAIGCWQIDFNTLDH